MKIPPAIAAIAPDGKLTPAQKRRFLIDMSLRRQKPGTGSSHEFMRRRTAMNPWPDLRPILEGLRWVIVGAVATRAYMPERMTKDLDVLVHSEEGEEALQRLRAAGYRLISRLAVPGYLLHSPEGIEVDILLVDYPWADEAFTRHRSDPAGYPVLDFPYLVLMKMDSTRGRDVGDLTTMLGLASDAELDRVRDAVTRYMPEALDDLESLIYLGGLEMQEPPQE